MNITDIADQITLKIKEIDTIRSEIKKRGEEKAKTAAEYDKQVSLILIGLRNGKAYELDGSKIFEPPATTMDKIARGLAWEARLEMDKAEANYKSVITNLQAVESQLNAWQSIFRHLNNN